MPRERPILAEENGNPGPIPRGESPEERDEHSAGRSENGHSAIRRVQRAGVSSLAVTLPKVWTDSMGIRLGDALRFQDTGRGVLEVTPDRDGPHPLDEPQPLTIVATDAPVSLISELVVGAYVSGQERVVITTRKGFSEPQREELHRTATRVPGLSVVSEVADTVTLQVIVDPTKRRAPSLLDHMTQLVQHELALCRRALAQQSGVLLAPISNIEEDLERTYLLLARELLISVADPRVAQKIGAEGPQLKLGYRLVANSLSSIGEQVSSMAHYLRACMQSACFSGTSCVSLGDKVASTEELLSLTMQAFHQASATEANLALTMIRASHEDLDALMVVQMEGKRCSVLKQRIASKLITMGELMRAINRETLNRVVEPTGAGHPGGRVVVAGLGD